MDEPFAAIPISWGQKQSPYHSFLIWVACSMSGEDGFAGMKSGEVKFSRRDAELVLGQGCSAITSHTRRAIKEGLLTPVGDYGRKRGEGQTYTCNGLLLETRRILIPSKSQESPKKVPSNILETCDVIEEINQDRTKTEPRPNRLIDKTIKKKNTISPKEREPNKIEEVCQLGEYNYTSVLWDVLEPFPKERKTWPLTIAKCFMRAIRDGTEPKAIYDAALALSKTRDPQYMPDAAKWLSEEGWKAYATG